jgi:DNA-binding response OmpR family regulator
VYPAAADVLHKTGALQVQNLLLWPARGEVEAEGVSVSLTRREMELLLVLAKRPGRVVQRQEIYEAVWGGVMPYRDRSVDVWVRKLRGKLATAAPEYQFVHTHYGFGYRLWAEAV